MPLSNDLITQFAKTTKDDSKTKNESTVYGTIVEYDGSKYIMIDGSELLTPISSTANGKQDDRVTATIKNHSVVVTGNLTSPSATGRDVDAIGTKVTEFETVVADKVDTIELEAVKASIGVLEVGKADVSQLEAVEADIGTLTADYGEFKQLTTDDFEALRGEFEELEAKTITTDSLDAKYANIDFANIDTASIENLYSKWGIIENGTFSNGTFTGDLVAVNINADMITAGTLAADRLLLRGEDGLYYKLNLDENGNKLEGVTDEELQNGLHGTYIIAKSITADKITVDDLVAFGATIGGFKITSDAIHSFAKTTVDNTTRGIYMDNDGQLAVGDAENYIKYYKDTDDTYKLDISAANLKFGTNNQNISDVIDKIDNLDIGGRNLLRGSRNFDLDDDRENGWSVYGEWSFTQEDDFVSANMISENGSWSLYSLYSSKVDVELNDSVIFSCWIKIDDVDKWDTKVPCIFEEYDADGNRIEWMDQEINHSNTNNPTLISEKWIQFSATYTILNSSTSSLGIRLLLYNNGSIHFKKCKLEYGNVVTDWTPAPEDHDNATANAQQDTNEKFDMLKTEVSILADSISNLVRGSNGESLMTQTEDGWSFNISSIQNDLQSAVTDIGLLNSSVEDTNSLVESLNTALDSVSNDLNRYTEYIKFGTDNGQPCIILGETDSNFKVVITNTEIRFMEGSNKPAYINNQSLYVGKAVISDELRQGEFVWMARENGNYGLLWRGE